MKKSNSKIKRKLVISTVIFTALFSVMSFIAGCSMDRKAEPVKRMYNIVLSDSMHSITFESDGGSITPNPALIDGKAVKNSEITFTAKSLDPENGVDKWEIIGGTMVAGGKDGDETVRIKITEDTTVKVSFKPLSHETYDVEGVSFNMRYIAAVTDGSLGDGRGDNEIHKVSLSPYFIGETEVTQELWQKVLKVNPSKFKDNNKNPVEQINWYQALTFCNKLSIKLGLEPCYEVIVNGTPVDFAKLDYEQIPTEQLADWNKAKLDMSKNGFRLPTEAEWEWAAKGGKGEKWAGTNEKDKLGEYAQYESNLNMKTHEVAKKLSNGYGLYDMSGNVFEWCWDWYSVFTPEGGENPTGKDSGFGRVFRGGGFFSSDGHCECAYRTSFAPIFSYGHIGMRIVRRR